MNHAQFSARGGGGGGWNTGMFIKEQYDIKSILKVGFSLFIKFTHGMSEIWQEVISFFIIVRKGILSCKTKKMWNMQCALFSVWYD